MELNYKLPPLLYSFITYLELLGAKENSYRFPCSCKYIETALDLFESFATVLTGHAGIITQRRAVRAAVNAAWLPLDS